MIEAENSEELSPVDQFIEHTRNEVEKVQTGLNEIGMLVTQSQGEVDKLAQRNAAITSELRQIQAQFDTVPREDIRKIYENAQDAQQRLFTMRGQLEKLQSDQANLKRYKKYLDQTLTLLEGGVEPAAKPPEPQTDSIIEKVITAQEEERRKISRQIHDGPAQALSNFILQTEIALRLFDVDQDRAREELENLKSSASATFSHIRDFIFDLRPMMLDDLGLLPTVRRYVEAFSEKTGLEISVVVTGSERRFEAHREVLAFRALQDLLGMIRDHAQATQVKVTLYNDESEVRVMVEENGKGMREILAEDNDYRRELFDPLEDRIAQIGGEFDHDTSLEQGSRIAYSVPLG
jgi:two-component system sensor histidine kinase DegS